MSIKAMPQLTSEWANTGTETVAPLLTSRIANLLVLTGGEPGHGSAKGSK